MESDLPWLIGAVRQLLLADAQFAAACESRLAEFAPSDVTTPYATLQLPTSMGVMGGGGYKPMIQLDAYCVPEGYHGLEASRVVWRIADRAKRVLDTARNVPYQTMHYSARVTDLMSLPADRSRGDANVLRRAAVRAELTVKNI